MVKSQEFEGKNIVNPVLQQAQEASNKSLWQEGEPYFFHEFWAG
jgi:hypothetical protein